MNFFLNKFLLKCLFKIPLWRQIDNVILISFKNLKGAYLSFHWFSDCWTRRFELASLGFERAARGFELGTRGFEPALLNFNSRF